MLNPQGAYSGLYYGAALPGQTCVHPPQQRPPAPLSFSGSSLQPPPKHHLTEFRQLPHPVTYTGVNEVLRNRSAGLASAVVSLFVLHDQLQGNLTDYNGQVEIYKEGEFNLAAQESQLPSNEQPENISYENFRSDITGSLKAARKSQVDAIAAHDSLQGYLMNPVIPQLTVAQKATKATISGIHNISKHGRRHLDKRPSPYALRGRAQRLVQGCKSLAASVLGLVENKARPVAPETRLDPGYKGRVQFCIPLLNDAISHHNNVCTQLTNLCTSDSRTNSRLPQSIKELLESAHMTEWQDYIIKTKRKLENPCVNSISLIPTVAPQVTLQAAIPPAIPQPVAPQLVIPRPEVPETEPQATPYGFPPALHALPHAQKAFFPQKRTHYAHQPMQPLVRPRWPGAPFR